MMKKFVLIILFTIILFFGISLIIGHSIYTKDIETKQKELAETQREVYDKDPNAPHCCKPPYGPSIIHAPVEQFFLNLYLHLFNKYESYRELSY